MNKIFLIIVCALTTFICKGQTKFVNIKFDGSYNMTEGLTQQYKSILYDSIYFQEQNLTFIRVLFLVKKDSLFNSLVKGKNYKVKINRKHEFSIGCRNELLSIRSSRGETDKGTLFGSEFIDVVKEKANGSSCDYMVIEYYSVEEIKKRNQKNFFLKQNQ